MKKAVFALLAVAAATIVACVYFVAGQAGAYAWNIAVFLLSPIAVFSALICIISILISLCRKRQIGYKAAALFFSILFALPITVLLGVSPVTYPDSADPDDGICILIPVKNAVLIGGKEHKSHSMWPSERYAYDLLAEPYDVGSSNLSDYGIFGSEVYSPVSGTVIGVKKDEADIPANTDEFISLLGNYIYIKCEETDTYLILAHFRQNSICVDEGEHIARGQVIGEVGNSGTTSEPHLHIQHQRNDPTKTRFASCAVGLPIAFETTE